MDAFNSLAERYGHQATFYLVYTHEAHPSNAEWPQSSTTLQRLERATLLDEENAHKVAVLVDPIEEELGKELSLAQWGYVVLSGSGTIEYLNADAVNPNAAEDLESFLVNWLAGGEEQR